MNSANKSGRADTRTMFCCSLFFACALLANCGGGGGSGGVADTASVSGTPTTNNVATVAATAVTVASTSIVAPSANTGLNGKLMVGYQGWFGCPGDFEDNSVWIHWFNTTASLNTLTVDAVPAVSGLADSDQCVTGLLRPDGSPVRLFSSQNASVVATHFLWMQQHGIDGAALQRFVSELPNAALRRRTDNVLANVQAAAELNGRVFYLAYDVSGANPASVVQAIRDDWTRVDGVLKATRSSAYLHDGGKPVLQLWGFGFKDHPGTPAEVSALIADLKNGAAGLPATTVIGGVPANWRTLTGDSQTDPAWAGVYRSYDIVSPWTVGRFGDEAGNDVYVQSVVVPDIAETTRLGLRYLPVVFPGFSWRNLMANRTPSTQWALNQIPRMCGNFMWHQVWNLLNANSTMMYAAMFDEVDEGTALFPLARQQAELPSGASMLYLDQDGCTLPADWYLSVTGQAAAFVRSGTLPPQALQALIRP